MQAEKVQAGYEEAVAIIKEHSKSFYQGFKMLPEEKFLAVASLYAFFRTADDLADEATEENKDEHLAKLAELKEEVLRIYKDEAVKSDKAWWVALEESIEKYDIPKTGFMMQIEGQEFDLDFHDLLDKAELIKYSRLVAGSVGRVMLPIISTDEENRQDPEFIEACENLGIAMQLTNILRDVGEDLSQRDRMYLPKSLLEKYNISKETIKGFINGKVDPKDFENFKKAWEEVAKLSDAYYQSFFKYLDRLDKDSILPVYASSLIYRGIMDEVRADNYNCLTERQFVSKQGKLKLIKKAQKKLKELSKE